jgi:hypothetical protein
MKTLPHLVGRSSHQLSKVATAYPKTDSLSELVQQITETDLVSLVETYAGSGRKSGRSTSFLCPLPSHPIREGQRSPSFVISTSRGSGSAYWKCYGACDKHGDALDFVEQMEGLSTSQAVPRLRSLLGLAEGSPSVTTRPKATRQAVTSVPTAPKPRNINGDKPSSQEGNEALSRYLTERAWPTEVAERFGLEVITYAGKLWVRHPYHDYDEAGTLIPTAYQDRLLVGVIGGVVVDSRWKTSTRPTWSRRGSRLACTAAAHILRASGTAPPRVSGYKSGSERGEGGLFFSAPSPLTSSPAVPWY